MPDLAPQAVCEHPECREEIDRGIAHACGGMPGAQDDSCGGYFCGGHLVRGTEGMVGRSRYFCYSCVEFFVKERAKDGA